MAIFIKDSSNVLAIDYLYGMNKLSILFKTNVSTLYTFDNVPISVFNDFVASESKGRFFFKHIKGKYSFTTESI